MHILNKRKKEVIRLDQTEAQGALLRLLESVFEHGQCIGVNSPNPQPLV